MTITPEFVIGWPEGIWLALFGLSIFYSAYIHGTYRTGEHNVFEDYPMYALYFGLLYWGGFFS